MQTLQVYRMAFSIFLIAVFALAAPAHAKDSDYKIGEVDVLINPRLAAGWGPYKMGGVGDGDYSSVQLGMTVAFKLGRFLLGGEYLAGDLWTSANKDYASLPTHPALDDGKPLMIGWRFGYLSEDWLIWYSYYGYNKIKIDATRSDGSTRFDYVGTAQMLDVNYRFFKHFYFGVFGRMQKFDKYSTKHPTTPMNNESLSPALRITDFGVNIGLIISALDL